MSRIVIAGGPRVGKTTLGTQLGKNLAIEVRHTDDLIATHEWSLASSEVALWFDAPGPWIIEGVSAVRALRKWLMIRERGTPCDRICVSFDAVVPINIGQAAMMKGCMTVWNEIKDQLAVRGVSVAYF